MGYGGSKKNMFGLTSGSKTTLYRIFPNIADDAA